MKECRTCKNQKELSEFYKHSGMYDGHLNICKECTKKRVGKHRKKNIDDIRAYDRERGKEQYRIDANTKLVKDLRAKYPKMYNSHNKVNNALRDGRIFKPLFCSWCGSSHEQIEGHHEDYNIPMSVVWLCSPCHKILHSGKGESTEKIRKAIKIPKKE